MQILEKWKTYLEMRFRKTRFRQQGDGRWSNQLETSYRIPGKRDKDWTGGTVRRERRAAISWHHQLPHGQLSKRFPHIQDFILSVPLIFLCREYYIHCINEEAESRKGKVIDLRYLSETVEEPVLGTKVFWMPTKCQAQLSCFEHVFGPHKNFVILSRDSYLHFSQFAQMRNCSWTPMGGRAAYWLSFLLEAKASWRIWILSTGRETSFLQPIPPPAQ